MRINNVKNVVLGSFCRWEDFDRLSRQRTVAIIDIDNCEFLWLRPEMCPALVRADILVEIHEGYGFKHKDFLAEILKRFDATHDVTVIGDSERDVDKYRAVCSLALDNEEVTEALKEYRAIAQSWLWLEAKSL